MRQILLNLVDSALKFTSRGEVVVEVQRAASVSRVAHWHARSRVDLPGRKTQTPPERVRLHVTARDTGIDIPLEQRHRLFQSFTPGDASATRKYGGGGLGLSICKRLVERMGGQIGVDSEPGRGSMFWFTVQLETPLAAVHGLDALGGACYTARQSSSV